MDLERRFGFGIELRAAGRRLEGYAAVFGVETLILDFTERVEPGAFARSLSEGGDILMLADHNPERVLARTRAGTLRLAEDSRGLHFQTTDLPNTSYAVDTLELVRSGNAGGASFAFSVRAGGERWDGDHRLLTDLALHEVSVVSAVAAYPDTVVTARSRPRTPRLAAARLWLRTL